MSENYQNSEIIKTLFPPIDDIDKIQYDDVGIYSITSRKVSKIITDIIKSYFQISPDNIIITDCTAGLGGNTMSFSECFRKVQSIEIDETRFQYLKHNLELFNMNNNVELYNASFIDILPNLTQDAIFIDPPWGGRNYKDFSFIDLYIDEIPLWDIVNSMDGKSKIIVVKIPTNFNINEFYSKIKFKKLNFYKLPKMNLIIIKNNFY